jgi:hypothetical protein
MNRKESKPKITTLDGGADLTALGPLDSVVAHGSRPIILLAGETVSSDGLAITAVGEGVTPLLDRTKVAAKMGGAVLILGAES